MSAYVIFCMSELVDPEALQKYRIAARPSLEEHGPRILGGPHVEATLEGPSLDGALILEFATMDAARAWYSSDSYRAALGIRAGAARMSVCLVPGR